ncbi:hypothetical protein M8542_16935 [Amycolatopsis sp. OK19-0408]|uniref:DUF8017 domain-containing protein n=1 Tax=Amycolatopsis iheyensis TaxID=2945988 RepID=A0A9X2SL47_9PSEU|nr:hypothetical protein [Amycolatopsis iheyensis]MCR6484511.1 hypothetical protein [Amycolatopsis iheyensis]
MGLFSRRPDDTTPGYEDNAALRGFGGYEPAGAPVSEPPRAQPKRIRPAAKPLKWRRAPWVGLVLIALIGGVLNALGVGKTHRPTSTPAPRTPVVETPSPRVSVPALVAGWQPVAARDGSYAYDVPPNWKPAPTTLHGWDKPSIRLITSAFLGENFCGKDDLGGAGVTTAREPDPDAAARKVVTDLATGAYGGTVQAGPGADAQITKADGTKSPARVVVAEVVPTDTGECTPKRALVAALAFGTGGTSGVVVAYSAADRAGGASREELLKVVESYRFVAAGDRTTVTPPPTTRR